MIDMNIVATFLGRITPLSCLHRIGIIKFVKTFFIATSNKGKQKEIKKLSQSYGRSVKVAFPDVSNEIHVDEPGSTFEENALLKARAYYDTVGDESLYYVGDDSGITIPSLNNEPGVFTRRWVGHEMTDNEILQYCLERMEGLKGDDRKAIFQTVLAVVTPAGVVEYFHGKMLGHILEQPLDTEPQAGFPFRSIFWVDDINRPIYELHAMSPDARKGFLSHREDAFKQLFERF